MSAGTVAQDASAGKPADRMVAVLRMGVSHAEARVLAAIAYHDGSGGAFPTIDRIRAIAGGMGAWTAREHINRLCKKGVLRKAKGQRGNRYAIAYDWTPDRRKNQRTENPPDRGVIPRTENVSDRGAMQRQTAGPSRDHVREELELGKAGPDLPPQPLCSAGGKSESRAAQCPDREHNGRARGEPDKTAWQEQQAEASDGAPELQPSEAFARCLAKTRTAP